MIRRLLPDLALVAGVLLIVYGVSRYSTALAILTSGAVLVLVALVLAAGDPDRDRLRGPATDHFPTHNR